MNNTKKRKDWIAFILGTISAFLFMLNIYAKKLEFKIEEQITILEHYKAELEQERPRYLILLED